MNESTVKRQLMTALRTHLPTAVAIRHEDRFTRGVPDLAISLRRITTYWEIKYADPRFVTSEVQHHTCTQLDAQAHRCRYIVFQRGIARPTHARPRQIRVVKPSDIAFWEQCGLVVSTGRFDYTALVAYIERAHSL